MLGVCMSACVYVCIYEYNYIFMQTDMHGVLIYECMCVYIPYMCI